MACGPSSIYILNRRGKILIGKVYKSDVPGYIVEKFVHRMEEEELSNPIFCIDGITHTYLSYNDIYILGLTSANSNCMMTFSFLRAFCRVLQDYFEVVVEESVRDNFLLIYSLLDEIMDYGIPQCTDSTELKIITSIDANKLIISPHSVPVPTGPYICHAPRVQYKRNEIFIDVTETVNMMISNDGDVIQPEVLGTIKMLPYLSGIPELKISLNDKLQLFGPTHSRLVEGLEHIKFHNAVSLARLKMNVICLVPPDESFDVLEYYLSKQFRPLINVQSVIRKFSSKIEYMIIARSQFKAPAIAKNVKIEIPIPELGDLQYIKKSKGNTERQTENAILLWSFNHFPAATEYTLFASFLIHPFGSSEITTPPIRVQFDVPQKTLSGIRIRNVKVIERAAYTWTTKADRKTRSWRETIPQQVA